MLDTVRLHSELQPDETLEWTGRPHPWHIFTARDWFLIPFTLVWGSIFGYVAVSTVMRGNVHGDVFSMLLGVALLLFVLSVIFGRFVLRAWELRHTWYGVTNQRIIILTTSFGHRVQSYYFNALPAIETRIRASGRGTLRFGPPPSSREFGWYFGGTRSTWGPGFYGIPDARYVFGLISRHRRVSP